MNGQVLAVHAVRPPGAATDVLMGILVCAVCPRSVDGTGVVAYNASAAINGLAAGAVPVCSDACLQRVRELGGAEVATMSVAQFLADLVISTNSGTYVGEQVDLAAFGRFQTDLRQP